MLIKSLNSVVNQTSENFQIIVSENSDTDDIFNYIKENYAAVTIIRRQCLTAEQHFQAVISECKSEFLTLFHDDDIMLPTYLEKMQRIMASNSSFSAAACNAFLMRNDIRTNRRFFYHKSKLISTNSEMIKHYAKLGINKPAPFPSYFYRTEVLQKNYRGKQIAGKYSDVVMIISLLASGPIYWTSEPLMEYRVHSSNDSGIESIKDRRKLLKYFAAFLCQNDKELILKAYRLKYLLRIKIKSLRTSHLANLFLQVNNRSLMIILTNILKVSCDNLKAHFNGLR